MSSPNMNLMHLMHRLNTSSCPKIQKIIDMTCHKSDEEHKAGQGLGTLLAFIRASDVSAQKLHRASKVHQQGARGIHTDVDLFQRGRLSCC